MTRRSLRDVPATVACEQRRIVLGEHRAYRHGCLGCVLGLGGRRVLRADLLAVVAAVDAIAKGDTMLARKVAGLLEEPGEAVPRVDHSGSDDRARRATADAPP